MAAAAAAAADSEIQRQWIGSHITEREIGRQRERERERERESITLVGLDLEHSFLVISVKLSQRHCKYLMDSRAPLRVHVS